MSDRSVSAFNLVKGYYWFIPNTPLMDGGVWKTPEIVHVNGNRLVMCAECHNTATEVDEKSLFIGPIKMPFKPDPDVEFYHDYLPKVHTHKVNEKLSPEEVGKEVQKSIETICGSKSVDYEAICRGALLPLEVVNELRKKLGLPPRT